MVATFSYKPLKELDTPFPTAKFQSSFTLKKSLGQTSWTATNFAEEMGDIKN